MRKLQLCIHGFGGIMFRHSGLCGWRLSRHGSGPVGVGLGMGLAAGLCGLGQGRAVGSTTEALARNPGTRAALLTFMIIGLAFIESLTLFTFAMIIIKIK
jgi:F0F1-type ATP synthase membrane subunit c/vacuolar-type H+-ATPase subunit K